MERGIIGKDYRITVRDSIKDDDLFDEDESEYLFNRPARKFEWPLAILIMSAVAMLFSVFWCLICS